jgi:hypothetical protein
MKLYEAKKILKNAGYLLEDTSTGNRMSVGNKVAMAKLFNLKSPEEKQIAMYLIKKKFTLTDIKPDDEDPKDKRMFFEYFYKGESIFEISICFYIDEDGTKQVNFDVDGGMSGNDDYYKGWIKDFYADSIAEELEIAIEDADYDPDAEDEYDED